MRAVSDRVISKDRVISDRVISKDRVISDRVISKDRVISDRVISKDRVISDLKRIFLTLKKRLVNVDNERTVFVIVIVITIVVKMSIIRLLKGLKLWRLLNVVILS